MRMLLSLLILIAESIVLALSPVQAVRADEITLIAPGGIRDAMQKRLVRVQGGTNAMVVLAKGETDIGLTFLSEIHNPGVEIVGVLPREISTPTALVGFVSAHARAPEAARALLAYLSSPEVAGI